MRPNPQILVDLLTVMFIYNINKHLFMLFYFLYSVTFSGLQCQLLCQNHNDEFTTQKPHIMVPPMLKTWCNQLHLPEHLV